MSNIPLGGNSKHPMSPYAKEPEHTEACEKCQQNDFKKLFQLNSCKKVLCYRCAKSMTIMAFKQLFQSPENFRKAMNELSLIL